MNDFQPKHYIHYNPERTDYSVTPEELAQLQAAGSNLWKDLCLVFLPLGVSCLLNAIAATPEPFVLTLNLFLNYLIGVLSIIAAIAFGTFWNKTNAAQSDILESIKSKPKMEIVPTATNVGAIPTTSIKALESDA